MRAEVQAAINRLKRRPDDLAELQRLVDAYPIETLHVLRLWMSDSLQEQHLRAAVDTARQYEPKDPVDAHQ